LNTEEPNTLLEGFQNLWEGIPFLRGELIFLGVLGYYLLAWVLVGRDPRKTAAVPMFEPPEGYSPAALRYLWGAPTGFDAGCFTAAVVGLAEKGVLRIERNGSTFHLHDLGLGNAQLLADEECVYNALFHGGHIDSELPQKSFSLGATGGNSARQACQAAWDGLKGKLNEQLKKGYRVNNRRWVTLGVWISLLGGGFLSLDSGVLNSGIANNVADNPVLGNLVLGVCLTGFWALVFFFCQGGVTMLRARDLGPGFGLGFLGLCFGIILGIISMDLYTLTGLLRVAGWMIFGYILNACFLTLMKRYSLKGRQVTDHIEGLRMYMNGLDGKHAKLVYAPQLSMAHHDQLLPYAVALGCTGKWAERFDAVSFTSQPGSPEQKRVFGGGIGMPEGAQIASVLAVGGDFHRALMASCGFQP
jgi:hypothetical protein